MKITCRVTDVQGHNLVGDVLRFKSKCAKLVEFPNGWRYYSCTLSFFLLREWDGHTVLHFPDWLRTPSGDSFSLSSARLQLSAKLNDELDLTFDVVNVGGRWGVANLERRWL